MRNRGGTWPTKPECLRIRRWGDPWDVLVVGAGGVELHRDPAAVAVLRGVEHRDTAPSALREIHRAVGPAQQRVEVDPWSGASATPRLARSSIDVAVDLTMVRSRDQEGGRRWCARGRCRARLAR